jgi:hypothetical protein
MSPGYPAAQAGTRSQCPRRELLPRPVHFGLHIARARARPAKHGQLAIGGPVPTVLDAAAISTRSAFSAAT